MKKLLLLTVISTVFFAACEKDEKEPISLEGTRWMVSGCNEGGCGQKELIFTATHATYLGKDSSGNYSSFTGTYTFDPPAVEIVSNQWTFWGNQPERTLDTQELHHTGTMNGKTMNIVIWPWFGDVIMELELKRQ